MKFFANIFTLILLGLGSLSAQSLHGVVFEKVNGEVTTSPMIKVKIAEQDVQVRTDEEGQFDLDLSPGTYKVEFSFAGYQTIVKEVEVFENEVAYTQVEMNWITESIISAEASNLKEVNSANDLIGRLTSHHSTL